MSDSPQPNAVLNKGWIAAAAVALTISGVAIGVSLRKPAPPPEPITPPAPRAEQTELEVTIGKSSLRGGVIRVPVAVTNNSGSFLKTIAGECLFFDDGGQLVDRAPLIWMNVQPNAQAGGTANIYASKVASVKCRAWPL